MAELHFHTPSEHHVCKSYRHGEWIIYCCTSCNYELRENWQTGKITVRNSNPNIRHSGSYFPTEYKDVFENRN